MLVLGALWLIGCAPAVQTVSVGVPITDELLASIEKGRTTKNELTARLGRPSSEVGIQDGSTIATWSYSQSARAGHMEGSAFYGRRTMPVVDTRALSVTFDEKGVVKAVTHASSHYGTAPITVENRTLP